MFKALLTCAKIYHAVRGGRYRSLNTTVTAAIWQHQIKKLFFRSAV